jgi:hypothetical protein
MCSCFARGDIRIARLHLESIIRVKSIKNIDLTNIDANRLSGYCNALMPSSSTDINDVVNDDFCGENVRLQYVIDIQ